MGKKGLQGKTTTEEKQTENKQTENKQTEDTTENTNQKTK